MYASRDFSPMPILADALQDAGCENDDILTHCQAPGPHSRLLGTRSGTRKRRTIRYSPEDHTMPIAAPSSPMTARGPRGFRWAREDYYRLADLGFFRGRRVERIHGAIIEMSPISWPHVVAKTKTADMLRKVFAGVGWVNEQSPFPTGDSDPEPDIAVYPGRIEDYTDHPTVTLLIVEVADSTLDHDTTPKAELYATAGVTDYWVLDLTGRRLLVFRDPAPLPSGLGAIAYQTQLTFGPTDAVIPLTAPNSLILVNDLLP